MNNLILAFLNKIRLAATKGFKKIHFLVLTSVCALTFQTACGKKNSTKTIKGKATPLSNRFSPAPAPSANPDPNKNPPSKPLNPNTSQIPDQSGPPNGNQQEGSTSDGSRQTEFVVNESKADGSTLYKGRIHSGDPTFRINYETNKVEFESVISFYAPNSDTPLVEKIILNGKLKKSGFAKLKPKKKNLPKLFRARASIMCIPGKDSECNKVVVDLFVSQKNSKKFYHYQIESINSTETIISAGQTEKDSPHVISPSVGSAEQEQEQKQKTFIPQTPISTTSDKESASPHNDLDESNSKFKQEAGTAEEYVGTKYTTQIDKLFKDDIEDNSTQVNTSQQSQAETSDSAETKSKDSNQNISQDQTTDDDPFDFDSDLIPGRPVDQAIGSPSDGQLIHPTNLLAQIGIWISQKFDFVDHYNESRERYYGTYELTEALFSLGKIAHDLKINHKLYVSDLSQKNGGRLVNSSHVSHQNGTDADIGYFVLNSAGGGPFSIVSENGEFKKFFPVKENLMIFNALINDKSNGIDRIFVNESIKKGFCTEAVKLGLIDPEFKSGPYVETLRRLRPWEGHLDHFHLRIKCSKYQRKCIQMSEPPLGTGCS